MIAATLIPSNGGLTTYINLHTGQHTSVPKYNIPIDLIPFMAQLCSYPVKCRQYGVTRNQMYALSTNIHFVYSQRLSKTFRERTKRILSISDVTRILHIRDMSYIDFFLYLIFYYWFMISVRWETRIFSVWRICGRLMSGVKFVDDCGAPATSQVNYSLT